MFLLFFFLFVFFFFWGGGGGGGRGVCTFHVYVSFFFFCISNFTPTCILADAIASQADNNLKQSSRLPIRQHSITFAVTVCEVTFPQDLVFGKRGAVRNPFWHEVKMTPRYICHICSLGRINLVRLSVNV